MNSQLTWIVTQHECEGWVNGLNGVKCKHDY